jgi:ATP-binding cassette subfamily F protein 3
VELGYFAQDQGNVLDPGKTVLEEMTSVAPFHMVPRLRDILGAFLFSGDAVDKKTAVLSGGERNRLALAKLLLRATNCLLLDEPTNHLDIHAKDVLLEALQNFQGSIVLVSHDRYILDALPQCIVEVGRGRAVRYLGNYEDYLRKKSEEQRAAEPAPASIARPVKAAPAPKPAKKKPANGLDPTRLTEEIARLEEEQAKLSKELSEPDFYMTHPDARGIIDRYKSLQDAIADLYQRLDRALVESGA